MLVDVQTAYRLAGSTLPGMFIIFALMIVIFALMIVLHAVLQANDTEVNQYSIASH